MQRIFILALRSAAAAIVALVASAAAVASDSTYQNDSITQGANASVQAGFVKNEIAASVFAAPPGDGPIFLQKARVLFFNAIGLTTTRKMRILVYDNGAVNPGVPIYTSPIFTFAVGGENLVDLSIANIQFPAGQTFTIGAKFEEEGLLPNFSSVVTDTNGIQAGKNRVFNVSTNSWVTAESLGITGDFGIRAQVTTHGPIAYGAGTAGAAGVPKLGTSGAWKVGNTAFGFQGSLGAPNSICYLSIAEAAFSFPILGITILVDPATTIPVQAPTNGTGSWQLNTPVPAVPTLAGQHFYAQAYFVDAGAPQGLSATAGLDILIDSAL